MSRRPSGYAQTLAALSCAFALSAPSLAHADTCSGLSLATLAPVGVGTTPSAVAAGDFDRNGRLDLAVANAAGNSVTILLGNGSGGFTEATGSPIATTQPNPVDIATGDVDQDGIVDLVVAFGSVPQAQVLRGLGGAQAGQFSPVAPFNLFTAPTRIYLARFTSEADLDLVVLAETSQRLMLYAGALGAAFGGSPLADINLAAPLPGESPSGAVALDFNRDGRLDLAVVMRNTSLVRVYLGDGAGGLFPGPFALTGGGPRDVAAGDVNRDGWPDLVIADSAAGTASVFFNTGGTSLTPQPAVAVGGVPLRVALADLDHDGVLDLAALDDSGTPRISAFLGLKTGPPYFAAAGTAATLPSAGARGLVVGRFSADGRLDLATALSSGNQAVVVENRSGTPCARASFAGAPRSYLAGNGPVSTAAADFDEDGRPDLAVVSANDSSLRILRNLGGELTATAPIGGISPFPRAVVAADMNADGDMDVVVAKGQPAVGQVQIYLGNGMGGLTPGTFQPAGSNTSALVAADFTGDGALDVVATSEDTGELWFFKGNGAGGLAAGTTIAAAGSAPKALVAVDLNGDSKLDLAVAQFGSNDVRVLAGNGDGTFVNGPLLPVGSGPQAIAAADLNGDGRPDLVTADNGASRVSVILQNGVGGFLAAVAYTVGTQPTAVALLNLEGDIRPDIAVTTAEMSGDQTLSVLRNDGAGGFPFARTDYPVRNSPQAITPIDVDSDGLPDLAVPCRSADAVVILLQRPPVLLAAPKANVRDKPRAAASGDFNGDGDLDLAVANSGHGTLSLMSNDGVGGLAEYTTLPAAGAEAVVAGDFNRDGHLDLVASAPGEATPSLAVFFGTGGGVFAPQPLVPIGPGTVPDDLIAADFDRDGDLDVAFCEKATGQVVLLANNGAGMFSLYSNLPVGNQPTALVAADFDRDDDTDLAVANDQSDDIKILSYIGGGMFSVVQSLTLVGGDTSPVALAAADFDADGMIDLAAASGDFDRIHLFRNIGGTFATIPTPLDAPYVLQSLTAADVNQDGKPDLVSTGAGASVFRGTGGMGFEPPQTVVARQNPVATVVEDFNRDGRLDAVVVNEGSDDVSILLSTACQPQQLVVSLQPVGCASGLPPYARNVELTAYDEGGNVASCATANVVPAIAPGTGDPAAILGGPIAGLPLAIGIASFTGGNALTIDKAGRRYRLRFTAAGMPPALTRSFTLGPTPQILGPTSVCPASSGSFSLEGTPDFYDSYAWSITPTGPPPYDVNPFAFTPSLLLPNPPLTGARSLAVTARVDGCVVTPTALNVFFGSLLSITLDTQGASSVCVDCIGGSAKAVELGGGTPILRQWGFRTVSGSGAITPMPGENFETYVLKGANFPGPGTYYVVVTTTPTCGVATVSSEWTVTVSATVPSGEVQHLAASSRGGPSANTGQNRLLWVNTAAPEEIRIRWNKAVTGTNDCLSPSNLGAPYTGEAVVATPIPLAKDNYLHASLELDTAYCYTVFVKVSGLYSPGRTVKARPFDATAGPVKWAYATGGTAVAPPTVSGEGILALSNDRTIHALTRGAAGGEWPGPWMPAQLAGVAHSRSPVVPLLVPLAGGANTVLFAADDATPGFLHAIDARTGNRPWPARSQIKPMTGAPGGIFAQYGGNRDALFVGTRDNVMDNELRALDLTSGAFLEAYGPGAAPGPIGPINGTPAIDYATKRIYFASHKRLGGDTLFCLQIGAAAPVFTHVWSRDLGNITGSPVLRDGRVYVGTDAGVIYSINAATGLIGDDHVYTPAPANGPVKGFLFPDRRNDDLIFATDTKVWSISDSGPSMTLNWEWTTAGLNPSVILYWPKTSYVYVGSANGTLYQLDFSFPPVHASFAKPVTLGGGFGQVGAPSLDIGMTPEMLIVGSEPGVLYGVQVPFP